MPKPSAGLEFQIDVSQIRADSRQDDQGGRSLSAVPTISKR